MIKLSRKCNLKVNVINGEYVFETTYLINLNVFQAYNLWSHYHNASFEVFKQFVEDTVKLEIGFTGKIA